MIPGFDLGSFVPATIGLVLGGLAYYVRSSTERRISDAMDGFGTLLMAKIDGVKDAITGISGSMARAEERHVALVEKHAEHDRRITELERIFPRTSPK